MKFAFITAQKVAFPITTLCRVLGVSSSGYYDSLNRGRSPRAQRDAELAFRICAFHKASEGRYGSPRIHEDLKAAGDNVGRKRVVRIMQENKLFARMRRKFRTTTDSRHTFPIALNVLRRRFSSDAPNKAWVTDITFLPTAQGWLYLAVIIDVFSRRVVGWATSQNVDRHLALAALNMATSARRPAEGLVHHSDQGSTYAAEDYRRALAVNKFECSMSRKGNCWDNAVAESFFATLKREMNGADNLQCRTIGTLQVRSFIEYYNNQRRHSFIGYKTPVEFELLEQLKKRSS
jgi:putative transposase